MNISMDVTLAGSGEVERIARGLIDRTLPKSEFTHQAHLRAGLWHVMRYSDQVALELLRARIRAYNEVVGGENTAVSGYHETITRFYVVMIRAFLQSADATMPIDAVAEALIECIGQGDLPMRFYSRARLFSPEARASWVEPDLEALPGGAFERSAIGDG